MNVATSLHDFERRLLEAAIQSDPEREILHAQVVAATVTAREPTGVGVFVRLDTAAAPRLAQERPDRQIAGAVRLLISHPRLTYGGGAIVWLEQGRIDCIECFAYGESWPDEDAGFEVGLHEPGRHPR